jgi:hypothetical protein
VFKFVKDYRYNWPVVVRLPADGSTVEATFTGQFKLLSQPEIDAAVQGNTGERALAAAVLDGWGEDLRGEDGEPLPVTDDNREAMLNIPSIRAGIVAAFFNSLVHRQDRTGNSSGPHTPGPTAGGPEKQATG